MTTRCNDAIVPHDFRDGSVYLEPRRLLPNSLPRVTGGAVIHHGRIDRRRGDVNSVVMVYIDRLMAKLSMKT